MDKDIPHLEYPKAHFRHKTTILGQRQGGGKVALPGCHAGGKLVAFFMVLVIYLFARRLIR